MDDDCITTLKILIIGESGVGKSSILLRFTDDVFEDIIGSTIGVDFRTKRLVVDDNPVKLAIWDTAGQDRYRTLTPNYYRNAQGAILVYDVSNYTTFLKLETWLNELETYANKSDVVKIIVANKMDLKNQEVSRDDGLKFARKHQTLFVEASAKTSDGVDCAFEELVRKIMQTPGLWQVDERNGVQINSNQTGDSSCAGYCQLV